MITKFPSRSSIDQTIKINEIFGSDEEYFTVHEILNALPVSITYKEKRGDMFVSNSEISYASVNANFHINLVKIFEIPIDGDFFDAAIEAFEFFINNTENLTVEYAEQ